MPDFEWRISSAPVPYLEALAEMERRVAAIEAGNEPELFWLLEHPPTYTAGTSAETSELLNAGGFPVYETGRGGRYTYHGPGQRVIYALCDLRQRGRDVRKHVWRLEEWIIRTVAAFGLKGERREGRVGIWVTQETKESKQFPSRLREGLGEGSLNKHRSIGTSPPLIPPASGGKICGHEVKIAAIGVRVRRWVTYHGLALNVNPNLTHFNGIVPCGLPDYGVTSLHALGVKAAMQAVDEEFRRQVNGLFSPQTPLP